MTLLRQRLSDGGPEPRLVRLLRRLRGYPGIALALLLVIWLGLPLAPDESGLQFGLVYRFFFTAFLVASGAFFWLLRQERIAQPRSVAGVLGSIVAVYLVTVGALIAFGVAYPQFDLPPSSPEEAAARSASESGRALFQQDDVGCFRCHMISGRGGTRGPDLSKIAQRAGERVSGLGAEQYLREKIGAGMNYKYAVPGYVPMMPSFNQMLTEEQVEDLIAFLLSLR